MNKPLNTLQQGAIQHGGNASTLLRRPQHSKVANYLINQRRNGQFCDLIIALENGDYQEFGHFCVVGAQSKFISGSNFMQKSLQFSIHNPLKVNIRNFNCHVCLSTMMDFFYEDMITITREHAQHFQDLARKLMVVELLNILVAQTNDDFYMQTEGEGNFQGNVMAINSIEPTDKTADVYLRLEDTFEDQQNYFKLTNPRAENSSSKINFCLGCDFKCYRVNEMITHMSSCEPSHLTCSLCEVGFLAWRVYEMHLKKHTDDLKKPFFCLECDTHFMTRAALYTHQPKHSTETPHICPQCGKGFKWRQGLNNHMLIHKAQKQMLCDVCGYSTNHKKALNSHKLKHTGEYFKCTFAGCTHRSNRKENLKKHEQTHVKAQHFVCEVCGCKFSQSKNLKRHALKHATAAGEEVNKYKCQLCSFSSHRSDKLKEHMERVHTEKAMQLELPETVENAFDSSVENSFDLPSLSSIEEPQKKIMLQSNKQQRKIKKVTMKNQPFQQTKLKTLAPKIN